MSIDQRDRRRVILFVVTVLSLAHGADPRASAEEAEKRRSQAVDPRRIDWIVPGHTDRDEVRDWFGVPDSVIPLERGATHWVYVDKWVATRDGIRAVQLEREARLKRQASATRFAENTKSLGRAVGAVVGGTASWLSRTFTYPPKPIRRSHPEDMQPTLGSVSASGGSLGEDEESAGGASGRDDWDDVTSAPVEQDPELERSSNLARKELWVEFRRDGIVRTFGFQHAAGFPGKRFGTAPETGPSSLAPVDVDRDR